jgi:hypothetical protein
MGINYTEFTSINLNLFTYVIEMRISDSVITLTLTPEEGEDVKKYLNSIIHNKLIKSGIKVENLNETT